MPHASSRARPPYSIVESLAASDGSTFAMCGVGATQAVVSVPATATPPRGTSSNKAASEDITL